MCLNQWAQCIGVPVCWLQEERFLFPIYPFFALGGAVFVDIVQVSYFSLKNISFILSCQTFWWSVSFHNKHIRTERLMVTHTYEVHCFIICAAIQMYVYHFHLLFFFFLMLSQWQLILVEIVHHQSLSLMKSHLHKVWHKSPCQKLLECVFLTCRNCGVI